jgi:hypothetical protein
MSGDSSRRRDKRSTPYEDIEGEEAFNIAVRQVAPKKSTPKKSRGSGSISGGKGSLTGQHVEDNGGKEGKTILIEINAPVQLGEIDSSYLVHYPLFPRRGHPPNMIVTCSKSTKTMKGHQFRSSLLGTKIHILSPSMQALTRGFGLCSTIPSILLCA